MKKLFFSLLLALVALPAARAQFSQIEGDPVDYDLIIIPRDSLSVPLVFSMEHDNVTFSDIFNTRLGEELGGEPVDTNIVGFKHIDFKGELRHTWDISPELIEEAIRRALRQTSLTRRQLATLSAQIDRYVEINYSLKDFKNDMIDFVTATAGIAGVFGLGAPGAVTDAINVGAKALVNGEFTYDTTGATLEMANKAFESLEGTLTGYGAREASAGLKFAGTTLQYTEATASGISLAENIMTIGRITMEQVARDIQKWDNRVAAFALWKYMSFYSWANYYLQRLAREQGGDAWVILINQRSQPVPVEFSGTHNSVTWTLSASVVKCGDLARTPNRPRYAHEGHYVGMIWAVADYDFSGFSRDFVGTDIKKVILNENQEGWRIFQKKEADGGLESREAANFLANIASLPGNGGHLDKAEGNFSLRLSFNTPVYLEFDEEGRQFDGVDELYFEHLALIEKKDFNNVAIARSLGLEDADPHSTTTISASLSSIAEGVEEHLMGQQPVPLLVHDIIEGDTYTFMKREGQSLERTTKPVFEFIGEHFPVILPYGELFVHIGEMLEPTPIATRPNDTADKARILGKYFK